VKLYHRTHPPAREAILREGFRGSPCHEADVPYLGNWFCDDESRWNHEGMVTVSVDVPDDLLSDQYRTEEAGQFTIWFVDAAISSAHIDRS
jgi:hypothetical protein